jgi:hypothetical protein
VLVLGVADVVAECDDSVAGGAELEQVALGDGWVVV